MDPPAEKEALVKSIKQLEQLYLLSETISRSSVLESVYKVALTSIKKILGVQKASILLFDTDGILKFKSWIGLSKKYRKAVEGHSPWKKNSKNIAPILIEDIEKEKSLSVFKKVILSEGIRALAFFPLVVKDNLIGKFMVYYKDPHHFPKEEIQLIQIITRQISFVVNKRKASEDFLNGIADGITVQDLSGKLIFANNIAAKASGYNSSEEMIKNPSRWISQFELMDEKGNPFKLEDLPGRRAVKGEACESVIKFKNLKTGEIRWAVVKANPTFDEQGNIQYAINIIHDVTERMELEKRKDEFISTASHELKTPIAALKGYTQILESLNNNATSKYYVSKINNQINRISKLVEDLLDVSKIQSGKLELNKEKFNIVKLIKETAYDTQLVNNTHQIIVKNGIDEQLILADKYRIDEVLNNLLSNAIKFSPEADKVLVKIENAHGDLIISVRDYGIGITKKNLQRIFEPFFQASSKIRQSFSGLGLGLYISSQIVKQHKGKMWVESHKGKGTTFYVALPQKS